MSITPVFNDNGVLTAYVAVQRDVTHLREIESDLALEAAVRTRLGEASQHCSDTSRVEDAAQLVCDQLISLPGIDRAHLIGFTQHDQAAVMAASGVEPAIRTDIGGLPDGLPSRLLERATQGSWGNRVGVDRQADQISAALLGTDVHAAAYGVIGRGDDVAGVVIVGTSERSMVATVADKLPHLIGFGASSNAVLVERLQKNRRDHEMREVLQETLATQGFRTMFQPVVEIETGKVTGYEALTRFDSAERPNVCFARAWSVGLGVQLELATLELAIATARRLPAGRLLNLNVSPRLLGQTSSLSGLLQAADRPVVIEITEHEPIADYADLRRASVALGKEVRIAVDDAGVGIANFGHIVELRPDFVKLDASLVRGVNADPGRQALVVAMCEFARTAGFQLIAEGVETGEEAATLAHLGVALGQGYYVGRPQLPEHWAAG